MKLIQELTGNRNISKICMLIRFFHIIFKEKAADFMENIINDDDFITILEGKCGTHSTKKMATSRARMCGCS